MGMLDRLFGNVKDDDGFNIDDYDALRKEAGIDDLKKNEANKKKGSEHQEEKIDRSDVPTEEISDEELMSGNQNNKKEKRSFFKKKDKGPEIDRTTDDIQGDIKKMIGKKGGQGLLIGLGLMIVLAVFITIQMEFSTSERPTTVATVKKEDVSLIAGDEKLWKLTTMSKVKSLENDMHRLERTQSKELNATKNAIIEHLDKREASVNATFEKLSKQISSETSGVRISSLEEVKKLRAKTLDMQREFEKKLREAKEEARTNNQSGYPNAIPDGATFLPLPNLKNNKIGSGAADLNSTDLKKEAIANTATNEGIEIVNEDKKEESTSFLSSLETALQNSEVFSIDEDDAIDYEEAYKQGKKEKNTTKPPLHIMTGFAEATLITGVAAPTFGEGVKNPKPVMLTIDSKNVIANDHQENLEDCIVMGTATGDMASSRVEILVTRLSCSAVSKKGIRQKIEFQSEPIGWVIGEDGQYGLKGRLVDSAGKLLLRQLSVGFLQGVSMAFSTPSVGIIPTTGNVSPFNQENLSNSISTGASQGVGSGLNSLAEYYKKMIDNMFPTIQLRPGRHVSIMFKGFDDVTSDQYRAINIDDEDDSLAYGDYMGSDDDIDVEVEVDYDNF